VAQDILGSNLGGDTEYLDWDISWFSSALPSKCRDSHYRFLSHRF
jgi:hypothetical protein